MCGIAGFWQFASGQNNLTDSIKLMADALQSRGPDDCGVWVEPGSGMALGHRRLSIVDLSAAGHQPMLSANTRFVLSYNGEIYNAEAIKQDLYASGVVFRGHCDSEVLLEACCAWGIEKALQRCIGMFALALWDRQEKTLSLARDRLGIKPLYWSEQGEHFYFASQSKAIRQHPCFQANIDPDSLALFLRYGYVPSPRSIFADIQQLMPGVIMTIDESKKVQFKSYWQIPHYKPQKISFHDARIELEALLEDAIKQRMLADVPLGAFLSGGVDSSTVVALMQKQSSQAIQSFSIGFRDMQFDESGYAKAVAKHLGTAHTEILLQERDALALIPDLATVYDEPFADSSQIPTYLLAKHTRKSVTVALSGDGGDELFVGYNRYLLANRLHALFYSTPQFVRRFVGQGIQALAPETWDHLSRFLPKGVSGDKLHKLAKVLQLPNTKAIYPFLTAQWHDEFLPVSNTHTLDLQHDYFKQTDVKHIQDMQLADLTMYLPDDILTKVDRASMAASLEVRVPLLDHRIVEFAQRLPLQLKCRRGQSKRLLREVLYQYVPKHLIERPKQGFAIPLAHWLRHGLKSWADDLLATDSLMKSGLLNPKPIQDKWQQHLSGHHNHQYALWNVLMFQAWYQRWRD